MLRVEDINHRPDTRDRLDKAAATQLVFEDAMIHVVDHLLRATGANRLVLTGGVALNAIGNMRLLEHFDEAWFASAQQRKARLHLWVPPTPGDAGVTIGAAWLFAHLAGAARGAPMTHAFYCGSSPARDEIATALEADDIASQRIGDISTPDGRDAVADLMAFMVAQGGVIALYQGPAETGPRALGHRSILANPCDPSTRERLNERVKYREAIRPLAPMATLEAAQEYFDLLEGASDADYNAYNYMVLTGAVETARARQNSGGHPRRRHRPRADRARGRRSPHLRLPEGARPPHRRRGLRQHLVQCRRSHCAGRRSKRSIRCGARRVSTWYCWWQATVRYTAALAWRRARQRAFQDMARRMETRSRPDVQGRFYIRCPDGEGLGT